MLTGLFINNTNTVFTQNINFMCRDTALVLDYVAHDNIAFETFNGDICFTNFQRKFV